MVGEGGSKWADHIIEVNGKAECLPCRVAELDVPVLFAVLYSAGFVDCIGAVKPAFAAGKTGRVDY